MNKEYKVYTVSFDGKIIYIGVTSLPLSRRLSHHRTCNKIMFEYITNVNPAAIQFKRIRKLLSKKLTIEEIETTYTKEASLILEEFWIQQFKAWNFELINYHHFNFVRKPRYWYVKVADQKVEIKMPKPMKELKFVDRFLSTYIPVNELEYH